MSHAIVTGATGFIGVHLVSELLAHGIQVSALCLPNDPYQSRLPSAVPIFTDMESLPKADIFYHLAWESASGPGRGDAPLQIRNAELTQKALIKARELTCRRFVALGTVYERLAPQILSSGQYSGPDFYLLSKAYAHAVAAQLAYKLDIEFVWCTICHPIGRMIKPDQMMAYVISSLMAGTSPPLGPAQTPYDIVSVRDVALGLRLLGQAGPLAGREYYIGSGGARPLCEWLGLARQLLGVKTPLGLSQRPDDGLRFEPDWFDISPLTADTGYLPQISFAEAVADVANDVANEVRLG